MVILRGRWGWAGAGNGTRRVVRGWVWELVARDGDGGGEGNKMGVGGWRGKGANLFLIAILVARYCSYPNIEIIHQQLSSVRRYRQQKPFTGVIKYILQVIQLTAGVTRYSYIMVAEINKRVNKYNFER
jgi:hypothetical protein